jgi:ABC-type antimicrobial peptide transport system permease subunit
MNDTFIKNILDSELTEGNITLDSHADVDEISNIIISNENVLKIIRIGYESVTIDNTSYNARVFDNFDNLESIKIADGSFPVNENEIAISIHVASLLNKGIGDVITLNSIGIKADYIITGITSSAMSYSTYLNEAGYKRLYAAYAPTTICVYLDEDYTYEQFADFIYNEFGYTQSELLSGMASGDTNHKYSVIKNIIDSKMIRLKQNYNIDSMEYALNIDGNTVLSSGTSAYPIKEVFSNASLLTGYLIIFKLAFGLLAVFILVITLIIIMVVLSIMVKQTVNTKRLEFGILKSLGFTTSELRKQLTLCLLPSGIVGAFLGSIIAYRITLPFVSKLFSLIGWPGLQYESPSIITLLSAAVIIIAFTYIVSYLLTSKIKRISAYELIEN